MRTSRPFTVLLAWALLLTLGAAAFAQEPILHDVRPGYGVTGIGWLSDYHAPLRGTPVDTRVYYMDSGQPGPTVVIVGGTHSNEIAGISAALLIVERAEVTKGRLIVIPYANSSGASITDTIRTQIGSWSVETISGIRTFPTATAEPA